MAEEELIEAPVEEVVDPWEDAPEHSGCKYLVQPEGGTNGDNYYLIQMDDGAVFHAFIDPTKGIEHHIDTMIEPVEDPAAIDGTGGGIVDPLQAKIDELEARIAALEKV